MPPRLNLLTHKWGQKPLPHELLTGIRGEEAHQGSLNTSRGHRGSKVTLKVSPQDTSATPPSSGTLARHTDARVTQ